MDTNKMRAAFEAWALTEGLSLHARYGSYFLESTEKAWRSWQASREAVVVQMPNRASEAYREEFGDVEGGSFNEAAYIRDVRRAIEAAGLKVAP